MRMRLLGILVSLATFIGSGVGFYFFDLHRYAINHYFYQHYGSTSGRLMMTSCGWLLFIVLIAGAIGTVYFLFKKFWDELE